MTPLLLDYYNRELQYLREMGQEFSRRHPKVGGRLGLHGNDCSDPHVERLLEGVAFLAARVHLKIDAEFPTFVDGLVNLVAPHLSAPVPSAMIARLLAANQSSRGRCPQRESRGMCVAGRHQK